MSQQVIPGLEGVPIAESAVSFVDGEKGVLEYRGINITELAESSTFEEVTHLLLHGGAPSADALGSLKATLRAHRGLPAEILQTIRTLPRTGHPMDALQAAVAASGMTGGAGAENSADRKANTEAALRIIAAMPTMVAAFARMRAGRDPIAPHATLDHAANFLYMLTGQTPDEHNARILDICLILHADHTMNASTFAARVVASTMATPSAVVSSAIGALSGPLHGGANERVLRMLQAIPGVADVERTIETKMAAREKIMGFGHRVYKTNDPRATVLRRLAHDLLEHSPSNTLLQIARDVETAVTQRLGTRGIYANVDFYSGLVYNAIGIETDLFTPVFAISRVSGWLAHWLEQIENNRIYRPRQIYVGRHDAHLAR